MYQLDSAHKIVGLSLVCLLLIQVCIAAAAAALSFRLFWRVCFVCARARRVGLSLLSNSSMAVPPPLFLCQPSFCCRSFTLSHPLFNQWQAIMGFIAHARYDASRVRIPWIPDRLHRNLGKVGVAYQCLRGGTRGGAGCALRIMHRTGRK